MTEPSEQTSTATICTCLNGPRCPEGNALWEAANAGYYGQGHDSWEVALDAWEVALNDYRDHVYQAAKAVADTADQRRRARAARRAVSDDELPGMWSHADLSGGWAYTQDGNPTPGEPTMDLTEGRLRPDLPAGDSGSDRA